MDEPNKEEIYEKTEELYHLRNEENLLEKHNFDEAKTKVENFLRTHLKSSNLNIFLGSGCSLPAVPLMGESFKELKKQNEDLELGDFGGDNKNIEGYLDWLSTGISYLENTSFDCEKDKLKESFEKSKNFLVKSIVKDYESDIENIDKTLHHYRQFYNSLFSIRDTKDYSPVNIFTTNYDLFNEVTMEELGIQYTNGFSGTVKREFSPAVFQLRLLDDENRYKDKWSVIRRYVKLYKIHGSIDWKYDEKSDRVVQTDIKETDGKDALIYPTIDKHLETQQTPYSELFRALTISLQKPNSTLIVVGYGFPDEHINHLISQSLMNEDFNLIVFGDKSEDGAAKFIDRHKNKHNFHFIGGSIEQEKNNAHYFSNFIKYIIGDQYDEK